jgi:hypothetical protein
MAAQGCGACQWLFSLARQAWFFAHIAAAMNLLTLVVVIPIGIVHRLRIGACAVAKRYPFFPDDDVVVVAFNISFGV